MTLNEEKILQILLKHDEDIEEIKTRLDQTATKEDLNLLKNMMDHMIVMMNKFQETQMVHSDILLKLVDKVEQHDKDIKKLQSDFLQFKG